MVPGVGDINVGVSVDGDILHAKERKAGERRTRARRKLVVPDDGMCTIQSQQR